MKRRLISMLLVVCMLLTVLPLQVFAAETQSDSGTYSFYDVSTKDWHYDAVQYVCKNGIFEGVGYGLFNPTGTMTRAMFVTVLGRMAGVDVSKYDQTPEFTDVVADSWYAPYVAWAVKHGVSNGTGDGFFSPDREITRQEMATLFVRYFDTFGVEYDTGKNITTTPKDMDQVADFAKDAIRKFWANGMLIGDGVNVNPTGLASRAEAATLCMRIHETVESWKSEPTEKTTYYEVKFAMGTGISDQGVTLPETKLYASGTKIASIPTPWKDGGIFLGWYYDAAMTQAVGSGDGITRNMTLYAKMADATADLSGAETPNYVTVTVPADKAATYSFGISGYTDGCVVSFTNVTETNAAVEYTVSGTTVTPKSGLAQGKTYRVELKADSPAVFTVNGTAQPATVRVLNIITEKEAVQNLTLDGEVKYLLSSKVSNMTGTALDGLFSATVGEKAAVVQNKNEGTFTYGGSDIAVGDVVAIYSGTRPDKRNDKTNNDGAVAYVEITSKNGNTYGYHTADSEEILFTPDVLPVAAAADTDSVKDQITVAKTAMDYSNAAFSAMGLDAETVVEQGDYLAFYTGTLETGTNAGYGEILTVKESGDNYVITYKTVTEAEVMETMDSYSTRNEDIELTNQQIAEIEADMVAQALESGFVEEAASYLTALAVETEGFQELSEDMDMDISSVSLTYADGTPVGEEAPLLMAPKAEITKKDVDANVMAGKLTHFEDGTGLRAELVMTFTVEIGSGDNKLEINLQAIFEQEVLLTINTSGGAIWKWAWIIPYIYDYNLNANIDVGTYTGIGLTATAKTAGEDEEEEGFDWKPAGGTNAEKKIIDIGKQITDLMEQKDKFMDMTTVPTIGPDGEEVESAGTITNGGLAEKYSAMMEDAEDSWIEILRVEIFNTEGHVDPLHILCYGISADFVVSANLYVTMGMTFEYGVAKRYNFSLMLFHKDATNETIDLEEEHYNFDFYVMGTLGIRAGIEFEIAVGLFSLKMDSVGICAEAGAYAQLWGYFYYHLSWSESGGKETGCSGAMAIEIGAYLTISLKAQLFSMEKLTYQPTLYENEWPFLTIGSIENVYDFAYGEDPEDEEDEEAKEALTALLNMEIESARTFTIPSDLFLMNFMDMKTGELHGTDSEDGDDEDEEPDNPEPGEYDSNKEDEAGRMDEEYFYIELSNPNFSYNEVTNEMTVRPPVGSVEESCQMTITWKGAPLAFSNQSLSRTVNIEWSDPDAIRFISFDSNGGSPVEMITGAVGVSIKKPASPTREGYVFDGWTENFLKNDSDVADWNHFFPTEMPDIRNSAFGRGAYLVAQWLPRKDVGYTVEYYQQNLNGNGYTLVDTETYKNGTTGLEVRIEVDKPTSGVTGGHRVIGVPDNKYPGFYCIDRYGTSATVKADGSTVVKVHFNRWNYTVTFDYGQFSDLKYGTEPLSYVQKYGSTVYVPKLTFGGYELEGYKLNGTGKLITPDSTVTVPAGNVTYVAQWKASTDTPYRVEHYVMNEEGEYVLQLIENKTGATDAAVACKELALKTLSAGITHNESLAEVNGDRKASGTIKADGSLTVKLYYDRAQHTLNLEDNLGNLVDLTPSRDVYVGAKLSAPPITNKGYQLDGWYTKPGTNGDWGSKVDLDTQIMPNSDLTLYAKWSPVAQELTVKHYVMDVDGEYQLAKTTKITDKKTADTITLADYKDTSLEVTGGISYLEGKVGSTVQTTYKIGATPKEISLYYSRAQYTLTWDFGGQRPTNLYTEAGKLYYGEAITAPTFTRNGYTYSWSSTVPATMPAKDATYTVVWKPREDIVFTVYHYLADDTTVTEQYIGKTDSTVDAHIKSDGDFAHYVFDESNENNKLTGTVYADGSLVLRVHYVRKSYTMTFDTDGGSTIAPIKAQWGTSYTKPADPTKSGYTFAGWTVEGESATLPNSIPKGDVTYKATWTPSTDTGYVVQYYYMDTYGSYPDTPTEVAGNATTGETVTADTTEAGFTLDTGKTNVTSGTVAADGSLKLTVYFKRNQHTLTFKPENGEDDIVYENYYYGAAISKPIVTYTGHNLLGWDPVVADTMPDEDVTYTAQWKKNTYGVVWNDSEFDPSTGYYGDTVSVPTPSKESDAQYHYTFDGWYTERGGNGTKLTDTSITLVQDLHYYAHFTSTLRSYTITWMNGETVVGTDTVEYGKTPVYTGSAIEKDGYDLVWRTATDGTGGLIVPVVGDQTYHVTWEEAAVPVYYDLWVSGIQVSSKNAANITSTDVPAASYDAETNTLELYNYNYSGAGHAVENVYCGAGSYMRKAAPIVYLTNDEVGETFTIVANGINNITNTCPEAYEGDTEVSGIVVHGANLVIKGSGTLNVTTTNENNNKYLHSSAIRVQAEHPNYSEGYCGGDLTIQGPTVNATVNYVNSEYRDIAVSLGDARSITIKSGSLTATTYGDIESSIYFRCGLVGQLKMEGGTATISGYGCAISNTQNSYSGTWTASTSVHGTGAAVISYPSDSTELNQYQWIKITTS